jgi:NADH dehydrogenase
VLILGSGFGGITTAIELGRMARTGLDANVLLVDRVNFHLFTPMLYQVATGLLEPGHVEYPTRQIARKYGFRFRQGQVEAIDLDQRQVTIDGRQLGYDRLVIALGSVTNYFGNASIERSAASLKTVGDAVAIRNRLIDAFEKADVEADEAARRALLTFVVIGGGATGVELVGSVWTLIQNGLLPLYPNLRPDEVRVILAEAGPGLLGGMDAWIGETAGRRLREKGIELLLSNPATQVSPDGITFKDGRFIASPTVVWAAGVRPSPVTAALPVERGRDGRLVVDTSLRLPSHPDAFVLGDCAWFSVPDQDGRPAPPNAQTAVRQAAVVARNVAASLQGRPLESYHYANEGNLVALGQGDGVALLGRVRLAGFPAWMTWRGFYLTQLMGFKNRLQVLVEWTSAYFGYRGQPLLDVGTCPPATVASAPTPADDGRLPAASAPAGRR